MNSPNKSDRHWRPMDNIELVERLCEASVPLRESKRLHIAVYGTLVPHIFMAEVLKRIGVCLSSGVRHALASHGPEVLGILEVLELGMTQGERETRNVIAISFSRDS